MKHKMNPVLDAQLNRGRRGYRGHKRNLSDPRFSTSLTDDYYSGVESDEVSERRLSDRPSRSWRCQTAAALFLRGKNG